MNIHKLLLVILILLLGSQIASIANQTDSNYWVYEVTELGDSYEVSRTNALTNMTEMIISVPKTPSFNLSSIIPVEELAAAEKWLTGSVSSPVGAGIPTFFERPPHSGVVHIVPSPDNSHVALTVVHSLCGTQSNECFGTTQIVIVEVTTGQQTVLWSIPMNADSPFFPYCYPEFPYIDASSVDARIAKIRWIPDQSGIVAEIGYVDRYAIRLDHPLIVIPIAAPENAFAVGNGERGWAIAPNSHEIASASFDCDASQLDKDAIRVSNFDINTGETSYQDYHIAPEPSYISYLIGSNYLQDKLVFSIMRIHPAIGTSFRLAYLNLAQSNSPIIFDTSFSTLYQIKSSLSGEVAVIEDEDGLLWRLLLGNDNFELVPITEVPVTYWQFANDNELIVKFEGDEDYSIIKIP